MGILRHAAFAQVAFRAETGAVYQALTAFRAVGLFIAPVVGAVLAAGTARAHLFVPVVVVAVEAVLTVLISRR